MEGSRYVNPDPDHVCVLDQCVLGDFDIQVRVLDVNEDVVGVSWIRVRCAPVSMTKAVLDLGQKLNRQQDNARKTSGDEGKMYAIGSRDTITEDGSVLQFKFKDNNGMLDSLQRLNTKEKSPK